MAEENQKSLIVKSLVYEKVKKNEMRIGGDFLEKLSKKVEELIDLAIERAKGHGKRTITGIDL